MSEGNVQDLEAFIDEHYLQCNSTIDDDMPTQVPTQVPNQVAGVPKKSRLSLTKSKVGDVVRDVRDKEDVVNPEDMAITQSNETSTPQNGRPEKKRKTISPVSDGLDDSISGIIGCNLPHIPDLSSIPDTFRTVLEDWMVGINDSVKEVVHKSVNDKLSVIKAEMKTEVTEYIKSAVNKTDIQLAIETQNKEIEDLTKENEELRNRCRVLEGRLARTERELDVVKEEQLSQKAHSMRDNVQFFNIPDSENDECESTVTSFLRNEMKVPEDKMHMIKFDRIHRVGKYNKNQTRVIVGKTTPEGKKTIFQHVRHLRKPYGVSDQLPRELAERKRQLLPQFKEARQQKKDVKWSADKLIIDGKVKSISKDKIHDINTNTTQIAVKLQHEVRHSPPHCKQGSTFQGHRVHIKARDDVIPALHAIYSDDRVGRATHNTYAYRLRSETGYVEHYEDDGEWGAGAKLLDYLRENDIENTLVCTSRWSGGTLLGRSRFNLILQVAKESLNL